VRQRIKGAKMVKFELTRTPIYMKQAGESERVYQAFQDFLKLPTFNRSVKALHDSYSYQIQTNGSDLPPVNVPSRSKTTLHKWHSTFLFRDRAAAYEEAMKLKIEERQQQIRDEALEKRIEREKLEIEEFRQSCLSVGRNIVDFAQSVIVLISTVPKEMQSRPLQSSDLDRLSKVSIICKNVTSGLVSGHDYWAQALGIDQVLATLEEKQSGESA
jgi:hypothetical protein